MRTRAQIVERARLHVGHRETSNNRSPLIDAWLRRCGLGPGFAWCAAFASWCMEDAACAGAVTLGLSRPATLDPQPGDLMWFRTDDKGHGHIGIVVAVSPMEVLCVEGNSANRIRYVRRPRADVLFARTRLETWTGDMVGDVALWAAAPLLRPSYEGTR